ncbi:MAG: hypothetical protein ACLFQW_01545 [Spirochaetaceae bacterium]
MKRKQSVFSIVIFLLFSGGYLFAQTAASENFSGSLDHSGAYGQWEVDGGRLYQKDTEEHLAKINFKAPQKGIMEYRFDVRYEGGGIEDRMGGFGVHLFVDSAFAGKSWGNGESCLLWLNYDEDPIYGSAGLQAQVYKSTKHFEMELLEDYETELPVRYLDTSYMDTVIPVKIQVDCSDGKVKVYDPTQSGRYFQFYLDEVPKEGNYFSFRTNNLSLSFDNLLIQRVHD